MADPEELVTRLEREVRLLAERLRTRPPDRWSQSAGAWGSRAEVTHHLAARLAEADQRHEGLRPTTPLPRLPEAHVLPDQLAVTGADLVSALRARRDDRLAAAALAEVLLHRHDLEGSPPPTTTARVVLDVLDPDGTDLLALARWECDAAGHS